MTTYLFRPATARTVGRALSGALVLPRAWALVLAPVAAALLALPGVAAAQPGSSPVSTAPAAPIGPAPAPPTAPPPAPPPVVVAAPGEPRPETGRPTELAFGIGVGYALPTSLETPNTTSVRVRLPSGLTFEPQLVFATTSDNMGTTNTHQNEFTLGSLVRYPLRVHRKVDLELIGNVALSSHTTDPDGDNNNTTTTTINLGYGGALSYWFSPHWNLSLTATNPLLSYNRNNQETGVNTTVTDKTTTLGVIWDPQVTVMIHLYD